MPSKGDKWYMGGSDGSGEYVVIAITTKGKLGIRNIGDKHGHPAYRVRCEPASWDEDLITGMKKIFSWWNSPEGNEAKGNLRFSTVDISVKLTQNSIAAGLAAIGAEGTSLNPAAPDWARDMLGKPYMSHTMESMKKELFAIEKAYKESQKGMMEEAKADLGPVLIKAKAKTSIAEMVKAHEEQVKKAEEAAQKKSTQELLDKAKELMALTSPFVAKLKSVAP